MNETAAWRGVGFGTEAWAFNGWVESEETPAVPFVRGGIRGPTVKRHRDDDDDVLIWIL